MKKLFTFLFAMALIAGILVQNVTAQKKEYEISKSSDGKDATVTYSPRLIKLENSIVKPGSYDKSMAGYTVTRTTGITFTSINATGTSFATWRNGTSIDDNLSDNTNIGFNFVYNGGIYSQFRISTNGFITLNTTSTATGGGTGAYGYSNANLSTSGGTTLSIAPMYDDLTVPAVGTLAGNLKYQLDGVAPNRILTVEWKGMEVYANAGPDLNYQVKLYEATGVIEMLYGTMTASTATYTYSCGINAATLSATPTVSELLTQQTVNTATFSNVASNSLATVPTANSKLTFTPAVLIPADPSGLTFTNITPTKITLNWTDNSSNEIGFPILISTDNVNFSYIGSAAANSTSVTIPNLTPSTTYYFRLYSSTEGYLSANYISGSQATAASVPLTGTKTIGGTLPDYPTFTDAISALYDNGVASGGVIFSVRPGVYGTDAGIQVDSTISIYGSLIPGGTSASKTVTFQKESGTVVMERNGTASTDVIIGLRSAQYITFNGIDVRQKTSSGGTASCEYGYYLDNVSTTVGSQYNTIKNCNITMNRTLTTSKGIIFITNGTYVPVSSGAAQSNNTIQDVNIQNTYVGISLNSYTTTYLDANNTIKGTTLGGLKIGSATSNDIGNGTSTVYGIYAYYQSGLNINNIEIRNVGANGAATSYGIYTTSCQGTCNINNNLIHDIYNPSTTSTSSVNGIYAGLIGTSTMNVYNNFIYGISSGYTSTVSATKQIYGIYVYGTGATTQTYNISYNNIRIAGPTNISSICFGIGSASGGVILTKDNIFTNFTGAQTGVAKHYCWYSTSATSVGNTGSASNYNDLYVSNTTNGFIGLGNATDYATLANWQTATSQDANSKNVDPSYTSSTDLHVGNASLSGVGTAISGITTDIDGQTRNTPPCIGADEFIAGVFDPGSFSATTASDAQINLNFTTNANTNNVIIVWNATGTFTTPTGAPPSVGGSLAGGTLIYNGTTSPYNHTPLTSGTKYYYKAFSYDGINYSTGLTANATTYGPPTLTTTAATNILYTTATTGGNISSNNGSTITEYGVCYSTSANPTTADSKVFVSGAISGAFVSNLTGLTAGTLYHIRSYAINTYGTSYGNDLTFTTGSPSTVPWTENFDAITIPSYPSYWYKENGDWVTTNNSNSTYDADARSGTQFLRETYSATNEYIWTPGFQLTAGTSYDFSFWWAGDNYAGWTGDVFYNTSQISTGATQLGSSFVTSGTTTTKTYAQVTNTFVPGSTGIYYFAIRVNATSAPWYLSFDDFSLNYTPACSNPPTSVTSSAITTTTARISWTAASPAPSNGYTWEVRTSGTPGSGGEVASGTTGAGVVTADITGLSQGITYYVYVRGYCGGSNYSTWSTVHSFTTSVLYSSFYYKGSGTLVDILNWGDQPDGSGQGPNDFTKDFQSFYIQNTSDIVLDANWVVSGASSKVIIGDGTNATTFTIPSNNTLAAIVDVTNLSLLKLQNSTLPTLGTLNAGSTVEYNQSTTTTVAVASYGNLVFSGGTAMMSMKTMAKKYLETKSKEIENLSKQKNSEKLSLEKNTSKFNQNVNTGKINNNQDKKTNNIQKTEQIDNVKINAEQKNSKNKVFSDKSEKEPFNPEDFNPEKQNKVYQEVVSYDGPDAAVIYTVTSAISVKNLTVNQYSTLQADASITVASGSTFTLNGTYIHNHTSGIAGIFGGTEAFATTSTFRINNWLSSDALCPVSLTASVSSGGNNYYFNNLDVTWNLATAAINYNANIPNGTRLTAGDLTLNTAGTTSKSFIFLTGSTANQNCYINGNLFIISSYLDIGNVTSGNPSITFNGNITISGTSKIYESGTGYGALIFAKNNGTQTLDFGTATTCSFTFFQIGTVSSNTTVQLINNNVSFTSQNLTVTAGSALDLNNQNLTAASTYTVTINGSLITGTGAIMGAAAFTSGAASNIYLGSPVGITTSGTATGNIQTAGTRTYNAATNFTFNGGAEQITGTGFPTGTIGKLTINNTNGVTLSGNISMNGVLTLTNGLLTTSTKTITFLSGSSNPVESANNRIVGTAIMDYRTVGTGSIYFLNCNLAAGSDNLGTVKITRKTGPDGAITNNGNTGIQSNWDILSTNPPTSGRDVTFEWLPIYDPFPPFTPGTLATIYYSSDNGTSWNLTGNTVDPTAYSGSLRGFTVNTNHFSMWTIGRQDAPLPVTLSSFMASSKGRDVSLNWKTDKETNNAGFEVERKQLGTNEWVKAGYVAGRGSSNSPVNYTFEDKKLNSGKYNYRLKQIDYNGNFMYHNLSTVVDVALPTKFNMSQNYPNPFNPTTKIDFDLPFDSKVSIILYDMTGREVKTLVNEGKTAGYYTVQFNASDISSGTYFYRIMTKSADKDFVATKKMVLVK